MTPEGAPNCCPPEMVVMRHESIFIRPPVMVLSVMNMTNEAATTGQQIVLQR